MAERSRWSPAAIVEWAAIATLGTVFDWLPESVAAMKQAAAFGKG